MRVVGERSEEIRKENLAVSGIARFHMAGERKVMLNDHLKHYADAETLSDVVRMWDLAYDIYTIAYELKEDPDNVVLMIIHLANEGRIEQRSRGLLT